MFWNERAELHKRSRTNVRDHFRSRHGAKTTTMFNGHAAREAIQETCCVLITCASCVNYPINRFWLNVHQVMTVDDYRATLVACNSAKFAIITQLL